jgi:hypothetical protein
VPPSGPPRLTLSAIWVIRAAAAWPAMPSAELPTSTAHLLACTQRHPDGAPRPASLRIPPPDSVSSAPPLPSRQGVSHSRWHGR